MQYVHTKYLMEGLQKLEKKGGQFSRAAKTVYEILGRINSGAGDPFHGYKPTNYGEKRLKHCTKYDLSGACRLVTVTDTAICFLLFVGDHKDTDNWLDKNRGKTFAVDDGGKLIEVAKPAEVAEEGEKAKPGSRVMSGQSQLLERMDPNLVYPLIADLPYVIGKGINELSVFSTDDDIQNACKDIADLVLSDAILDVLIALVENNIKAAESRIKLYNGEYIDLESAKTIEEALDMQFVPEGSDEWLQLYQHFARTADYKDWMLFLHPDQRDVVERDFKGPAKLLGVSGSGKTCVVIKRALRLAEKYESEKVLVLTLNRSLAKLISDLVVSASPEHVAGRIDVKPFFEICQQLIYTFEPGSQKIYSDVTWKSEEHIDAIWREFYRCDLNNQDAKIMLPVHDSLIAQGVDAESYIREEFDWIRSAIAHKERDSYIDLERKGRSFSLQPQQKKLLLKGLSAWENKMHAIGVVDGLGLVSALQPYLDQVKPAYRCIMVDESQDFGTSELDIIRRSVAPGENDLFLCGDAAQQVSSKYQKLAEANISIPGARSHKIKKNYRNSREILTAAQKVLTTHINEWLSESEEFEVLDPDYADFSGSEPILMKADDLQHEIANAVQFIRDETTANPSWKGCIAFAGYSLYEVQVFGRMHGFRVLDGTSSIEEDALYISDLAQTKGFEFDVMVVVNARDGVLPNPAVPKLEQAKDLAQLYVAMTRAKSQLVLSYHGQISPLLTDMDDVFSQYNWSDYLQSQGKLLGLPPLLAELNEDTQIPSNVAEMDGPQFLYTEHALGQSQLLIDAIRAKIGRSQVGGGEGKGTVGVDLGFVHQMSIDSPSARNRFGREATKQLQELGMRLGLSRLHRERLADEAG